MSRLLALYIVSFLVGAAPCTRAATPIVISAAGGPVALPTSGLAVNLPARENITCKITGQWSLMDGDAAFLGRDVIDEFDGEGNLRAGSWIIGGNFTAEEAPAILQGTKLTDAWEDTVTFWDAEWKVRGGNYTFSSDLGVRPTVVFATTSSDGGPSLLLHHFLLAADAPVTKEAMLAQVRKSPTLRAVFRAYCSDQYAQVRPTQSEAVTQPAHSAASRIVQLPNSGLRVQLPDDGFVWLSDAQTEDATDKIHLVAPRLPNISIELLLVDAPDARAAFAQLELDGNPWGPAPANLPPGWQSGVTVTTSDNIEQATVCTVIDRKVLVVGFLATHRLLDTGPYRPLLEALADAVRHPASLSGILASE